MQTLKPAPTLKDLRNRIDEAIEIAGEDATWNGFDTTRPTNKCQLDCDLE